jgi:hypothetical protein
LKTTVEIWAPSKDWELHKETKKINWILQREFDQIEEDEWR